MPSRNVDHLWVWTWVLGRPLRRCGDGLEDRQILRLEHVPRRMIAVSVAILHRLHAKYASNEHHRTARTEGCNLNGHILNAETLRLDRAKQLSDHPAPNLELRGPPCLFEDLDPIACQQPPMYGHRFFKRVQFARLDSAAGFACGIQLFASDIAFRQPALNQFARRSGVRFRSRRQISADPAAVRPQNSSSQFFLRLGRSLGLQS